MRGGGVMPEEISTGVIPGRAHREPGISLNNLEVPDRSASRPVRNDAHKTEDNA
jgi:hypothetical protein